MIGQKKNDLIIYDLNNEECHRTIFDTVKSLYDEELFIIDTRESGFDIASYLIDCLDEYGWKVIDKDDITFEINGFLDEIKLALGKRVIEVLEENNVPYEK